MDLLIQLLVTGVINGSHYALLGIGFGLIFATTRIVHFAYGPVFTFAAYVAWGVSGGLGLPIWLGLIAAIAPAHGLAHLATEGRLAATMRSGEVGAQAQDTLVDEVLRALWP